MAYARTVDGYNGSRRKKNELQKCKHHNHYLYLSCHSNTIANMEGFSRSEFEKEHQQRAEKHRRQFYRDLKSDL